MDDNKELTGKLSGWASARDVMLKLTGMLSVKGGTGPVIEYSGEGCRTLPATGKATICNADGTVCRISANHSNNETQMRRFRAGSALNMIRETGGIERSKFLK